MADKKRTPGNSDGADWQDAQLRAIFMRDARDIADDGFSAGVIRRLGKRRNTRGWVLGAATLVGLGLALRPLTEGLMAVAAWGQQYTSGLQSVNWTSYTMMAGGGLALLLIPLLARLLDD